MQLNFRRQAGATLIEIIMVVALIAIITIGALTYFNSASESSKVQETITGLTAMSSAVRNQFNSQGHYSGITSSVVARFGNVPKTMRRDDTDFLKHAWNTNNSAVDITPITTVSAGTASHFSIRLNAVPARVCMDLVTKTYKSFVVNVGGVPNPDTPTITTIAQANTACGTGGEGASVDIFFASR
jgi:type II secretory pathway pseudopilin PulG